MILDRRFGISTAKYRHTWMTDNFFGFAMSAQSHPYQSFSPDRYLDERASSRDGFVEDNELYEAMNSKSAVVQTDPAVATKSSSVPTPYLPPRHIPASSWNTQYLGWRVTSDAAAAACATALVSPVITIIDRYNLKAFFYPHTRLIYV